MSQLTSSSRSLSRFTSLGLAAFAGAAFLGSCVNGGSRDRGDDSTGGGGTLSVPEDIEARKAAGGGPAAPAEPAIGPEPAPPEIPLGPIVVDQFGYRPESEKLAVIRFPQVGSDAVSSFTPGSTYELVDAATGESVHSAALSPWHEGAVDDSSGDAAWWFDFSDVETPGYYYVVDPELELRSDVFRIDAGVYRDVLRHALRTFFYQRAGSPKDAAYAGGAWADAASHLGPLQDSECRLYSSPDDASTERELSGGWYDAGDYNKYTSWHSSYVVELLRTYRQVPEAFGDDFGIPESGNGDSDLIDEARWGLAWLEKMQDDDGSLLSVMGLAGGSPPSSATEQSLYGSASTSATLSAAAAFAYGANVLGSLGDDEYADSLRDRALAAWDWAEAHPAVKFRNNDESAGTGGLAAGQQELSDSDYDYGILARKLAAAVYLYEATDDDSFREFFDTGYRGLHLFAWGYAYPYEATEQVTLLEYTRLPGATASVVDRILSTYADAMQGEANFAAFRDDADPYGAFLDSYVWGSNGIKSKQGLMFADHARFGADPSLDAEALRAAERYVHYLHGVNPLGIVYLSNMGSSGALHSVTNFYHSWFADGSELWDSTEESAFGPPPGFLVGGPNPGFSVDSCCPDSCRSAANNALCTSEPLDDLIGQPAQKSFKDFNASWPLNSWSVTENSNGYQVAYLRLLAQFVE